MILSDFIVETAEKFLESQNENGSFSPGHNGPYHHPETPVRNSAHWLIILARCYELTGDVKFKNRVKDLADYLVSNDARPFGYSFYCREKGTDKCNGLIGQAWSFEALAEASKILGCDKYMLLAEEVFFQHPFSEGYGLWHRLEIDGRVLPIDMTFNHQLWFAACASLIGNERNAEMLRRIRKFMDSFPQNLIILKNGLVYHKVRFLWEKFPTQNVSLDISMRKFFHSIRRFFKENEMYRSIGYHSFNMYAFTILKTQVPEHPFWATPVFSTAVNYMLRPEYITALDNNRYAYPYNPPGFEIPYSLNILGNMNEEELLRKCRWWVNEQFKRCYDKKTGMMDKNTEDPLTHTARIYELTRLQNDFLKKIHIEE